MPLMSCVYNIQWRLPSDIRSREHRFARFAAVNVPHAGGERDERSRRYPPVRLWAGRWFRMCKVCMKARQLQPYDRHLR